MTNTPVTGMRWKNLSLKAVMIICCLVKITTAGSDQGEHYSHRIILSSYILYKMLYDIIVPRKMFQRPSRQNIFPYKFIITLIPVDNNARPP